VVNHPDAGIFGRQTVCDFAGTTGGRIIHDDDLVLASHTRQDIEGFEGDAFHGTLVVINGEKDAHPRSFRSRLGAKTLVGL
jgi:hypothetical protein